MAKFNLGFDWDSGNWPKCGKHGVSREEIEYVFVNDPQTGRVSYPFEERWLAVGKNELGRYVSVIYTRRIVRGKLRIRPISVRYMHKKEIDNYEKRTEKIPLIAQ